MKKILIIEDDVDSQDIYKEVLTAENFEVVSAINGNEGLVLMKAHKPDLVLLDVMLPGGLNGFDVLEQMKRNENLKNIPVIVLTNLDSEEKTAKSIGATDYIVKTSATLSQIVEKVKSLLK